MRKIVDKLVLKKRYLDNKNSGPLIFGIGKFGFGYHSLQLKLENDPNVVVELFHF
jgi:hypothetical protein